MTNINLSCYYSSRYLLNAVGLYPLSPASGDYVLGSPLFANVTLTLGGLDSSTTKLTVAAINQGPDNVYVQGVTLNGQPVGTGMAAAAATATTTDGGSGGGVAVSYRDLMAGGALVFTMGPNPPTN
jgi:putative alpha-1,2-mannosidase